MAVLTVNYNGSSYYVDNGINKKGFKFDNPGGGSQRTFNINSINLDVGNMLYQMIFSELDTDEVNGYEAPVINNIVVNGALAGMITSGQLDLLKIKIDGLNKIFDARLGIEPLNPDGTLKPEYQ